MWTRFNAGRDDQLWYYGALADAARANHGTSRAPLEELAEATHVLRESFRSTRQVSQAVEEFLEVLQGHAEPVECIVGEGAAVAD